MWGVGVVGGGADVVDVEVAGLGEGAFDAVVAGVDAVDAVGVGACALALGQGRGALGVVGVEVGVVLGLGDEGVVAVVEAEVDVGLFLERGVEPAVVDAESDEVDVLACDALCVDGGVLFFEVVGEFRPVVAAVRFGEDSEVAVFVLWELGVEGL